VKPSNPYSGKSILFYLILFACVILICVILTEALVRFAVYGRGQFLVDLDNDYYFKLKSEDLPLQFKKKLYVFDKRMGIRLNPNNEGIYRGYSYPRAEFRIKHAINSSGFKSQREFGVDEDKIRIALLGDSFVKAFQVNEKDSLVKELERNLGNRDIQARVYNFGHFDYGTISEYRLFFDEVLKIKPHVVILSFFRNDLINNSPYYLQWMPAVIPRYTISQQGKVNILDFKKEDDQERKYVTYNYKDKRHKFKRELAIVEAMERLSARIPFLMSIRYINYLWKQYFGVVVKYDIEYDVYKKKYSPVLNESVYVTRQLIQEINQYCTDHNIKFSVVLMPAIEQVSPKVWHRYVHARRMIMDKKDFDTGRPNNILAQLLKTDGIPTLNMVPIFRKLDNVSSYYFLYDLHFNELGNAKAAEILEEFLFNQLQ